MIPAIARRAALLAILTSLTAGCSDRLAPPTGNSAAVERTIVFSWSNEKNTLEDAWQYGTIPLRGQTPGDTLDGMVLASGAGTLVLARIDEFGLTTLGEAPPGADPGSFKEFAGDTFNERIDRSSVTISDDGTLVAWYSGNSSSMEFYLNVYDLPNNQIVSRQTTMLGSLSSIGTLPPPSFSPDGSAIVYADYEPYSMIYVLMVAELSGGQPRIIAEDLAVNGPMEVADWHPFDNSTILYAGFGTQLEGPGIYTTSVTGINPLGNIVVRAPDSHIATCPTWSPDGTMFVYATQTMAGQTTLNTVNPTTHAAATLARANGIVLGLTWSADGRQLLYIDSEPRFAPPDFQTPVGNLMALDVLSQKAIPVATNATKGFWVEQ